MKKQITLLKTLLLAVILLVGSGSAWGAQGDVAYTLDLKYTLSNGAKGANYTAPWDWISNSMTWSLNGAANNNGAWAYVRFGGKSNTSGLSYAASKTSITLPIEKVIMNVFTLGGKEIATNAFTLIVASDATFATVIDQVSKNKATGAIEFLPTAPATKWPANSYYKLTIAWNNSTSSNVGTDVTSVVFYEGASASCTTPTTSFASSSVNKLTTDAAFTNTFTSDNTSTKVWSSTNEAVATVDAAGEVTIHSAGTASIKVNQAADATYCAVVDASYALTVTAPAVAEPTNHATLFTATTNSASQITVTWTDAIGGQLPAGYLVIASTGTPTAPVDGIAQTNAALVENIAQGTQQAVFTGLDASTTYNFSIWPYTNSGAAIDYKTDGVVPTANATTLVQPWTEDFETGTKASYTAGDIACTKGSWNISEALIGTSASDRKNGSQSIRLRYTSGSAFGELKMNFDKNGAGTVSVSHAKYGTDIDGSWKLQMSIDGGTSWSDVGSTVNTTSTTLSAQDFTINQSGNVRFKIVQLSGNRVNIDDISITEYSAPATSTWSGSTSTNWNLALNWNNGSPASTTSVTLADVTNDPIINSSIEVSSLTINTGSILTVNAGKQLTVSAALTNNGTLNLWSTEAGGTATLTAGSTSGTGIAHVSQYLKDARNWYVASPVSGADLPATGYTLYERDEANASWPTPTGTFTQGRGYIAFPDAAASTLTFSGALNLANVDVALTWSGASSKGFNLIGNPYPSHLTWTKAFTDANVALIEPSIYYRTNGGTANNSGLWSTPTYNAFSGASVGGATAIIPPMQAVWVRAIAAGTLTLDNSKLTRSHQGSNPLKAPAVVESQKLRLVVTDGQASDEILLYFNANASNAYDRYDSPKMINGANSSIPDIFTMADNEQLVINGMSTIPTEIPLYFKANASTASQFSVSATEFSNFEVGTQVYIKNKNTSIEQLISDGTAYSFNASANPSFSIIIKAPGVISGFDNNSSINFHVFANAIGQITIASPIATGNDVVSVYNAVGQRVLSQNLTSTRTVLNKTFTSGVYVVEVNGVSHKVIVK